jgi:hypothetical protein
MLNPSSLGRPKSSALSRLIDLRIVLHLLLGLQLSKKLILLDAEALLNGLLGEVEVLHDATLVERRVATRGDKALLAGQARDSDLRSLELILMQCRDCPSRSRSEPSRSRRSLSR